jgi:hypothetical protein
MNQVWWDDVLAAATAMVALLDVEPPDDEAVVDAATALRDALRPYV